MSEEYIGAGRRIVHARYENFVIALNEIGADNFAGESDIIAVRNASPFVEHTKKRAGEIADVKSIWETYSWLRGMRLYSPGEENPAIYLRDSLLLDTKMAEAAVKRNSKGIFFSLTAEVYQEQLQLANDQLNKPSEERSIYILPSRGTFPITRDQNFDVMNFAAQSNEQAEKYFDRLAEKNITTIMFFSAGPTVIDKPKMRPFCQQSILSDLRSRSGFISQYAGLDSRSGAAAVYPHSD